MGRRLLVYGEEICRAYKEQSMVVLRQRKSYIFGGRRKSDGAVIIGAGYKIRENKNYLTNTFTLANNIDYPWCDF